MADNLDQRLARGRTALLEAIEQPPLARVRARGRALRRRRQTTLSGAAALLVALGVFAAHPWAGPPPSRTADRPPTPPAVTVYTGSGVTLSGLEIPVTAVPDLPGTASDVQFPDAEHGFVVTACGGCQNGFARTSDGGRTWTGAQLPLGMGDRPGLIAFDRRRLVLLGGGQEYFSTDAGDHWRPVEPGRGAPAAAAGDGDVLRLSAGGLISVWGPDGWRGPLATQPEHMTVTWVAAAPSADGQWWAGGRNSAGQPVVAVTADRGRHWRTTAWPGSAVSVQVSGLGSHVYAAVLGEGRRLLSVYHSADGGRTFHRTGPVGTGPALAGELVPLLDGTLLVTTLGHEWWVGADDGRTFARATGDLPSVGRLARTGAGYLAYELFSGDVGWLALSTDGSTWYKLQIR